jgi:hypothetical protein
VSVLLLETGDRTLLETVGPDALLLEVHDPVTLTATAPTASSATVAQVCAN